MQDTNYKRLRSSWLLLLVYVPMLLAVTLHRHDGVQEADAAFYCEDCARNVHHDGHLVAFQPALHACVLCQLQSIPYLPPLLLTCAVIAVRSACCAVWPQPPVCAAPTTPAQPEHLLIMSLDCNSRCSHFSPAFRGRL